MLDDREMDDGKHALECCIACLAVHASIAFPLGLLGLLAPRMA